MEFDLHGLTLVEAIRAHPEQACIIMQKQAVKLAHQANDSDYEKCAGDILKLDLADDIINKHGCLVAILKQHFIYSHNCDLIQLLCDIKNRVDIEGGFDSNDTSTYEKLAAVCSMSSCYAPQPTCKRTIR